MQIIEPQIRTVFQGLRGIVYGEGKNSPPPLSSPIPSAEFILSEAEGLRTGKGEETV